MIISSAGKSSSHEKSPPKNEIVFDPNLNEVLKFLESLIFANICRFYVILFTQSISFIFKYHIRLPEHFKCITVLCTLYSVHCTVIHAHKSKVTGIPVRISIRNTFFNLILSGTDFCELI